MHRAGDGAAHVPGNSEPLQYVNQRRQRDGEICRAGPSNSFLVTPYLSRELGAVVLLDPQQLQRLFVEFRVPRPQGCARKRDHRAAEPQPRPKATAGSQAPQRLELRLRRRRGWCRVRGDGLRMFPALSHAVGMQDEGQPAFKPGAGLPRPIGTIQDANHGISTVAPSVEPDSSASCAFTASFSGYSWLMFASRIPPPIALKRPPAVDSRSERFAT